MFASAKVETCDSMKGGSAIYIFIGLNAIIAVVCFVYMVLSFRAIRRSLKLYVLSTSYSSDAGFIDIAEFLAQVSY